MSRRNFARIFGALLVAVALGGCVYHDHHDDHGWGHGHGGGHPAGAWCHGGGSHGGGGHGCARR